MDFQEKMQRFNQRWNITSSDSYEEAFLKFKTRVLNIFDKIDNHLTEESITAFCQYYGIKEEWHSQTYGDYAWSTLVADRLNEEDNEMEFYRLIELILSLDIRPSMGYDRSEVYSWRLLVQGIIEAIELSAVNVAISVTSDDDVILFPKGEKELDDKLVNSPLSFLMGESSEHFIQALKFYQAKKYVKSAESLRRSLEEFLRAKLNNQQGLKANLSEMQQALKKDGRDSNVRNITFQIFNYLDKYFNENSKHNDGEIDGPENEFLIYHTGLLMRFIESVL